MAELLVYLANQFAPEDSVGSRERHRRGGAWMKLVSFADMNGLKRQTRFGKAIARASAAARKALV